MAEKSGKRPQQRRNPLFDHPLLRKGAVHGKSGKAHRRAEKVRMRREWGEESVHAAA